MKIVHVIGFFQPEYGYEEYYTALNQVKLGHDVHVITSDRIVNVPSRPLSERLKGIGIFNDNGIVVHRLPVLFDKMNDFVITWGVSRKLKELKPDIVHCHNARQLGQFIAALMKDKLDYSLIVDHHDYFYQGHYISPNEKSIKKILSKYEYKTFRKLLGRYIFSKADKIIAIENICKNHLIEYFKISSDKIFVNHLGVETTEFSYSSEGRKIIREKYKILNNEIVILYMGLFTRRKRVDLYLEMVEMMQNEDIKLLMVGSFDEHYQEEISNLIVEKGLNNKVILAGKIDKNAINDYISSADLGVYLANSSVVWLELMACGLPLIAPENMQFSHLLKDNARTIEIGNVNDSVKEIKYLIKNNSVLMKMGKRSKDIINKEYSYKITTNSLMTIYKAVLDEKEN